jgi:uncharacterized membrane protein HdeD (DUF308 family)
VAHEQPGIAGRGLVKLQSGYQRFVPLAPLELSMLILGVILLLIGIFLHVPILTTIGVILLVVGAVLFILGSIGRPVAGRRHYW